MHLGTFCEPVQTAILQTAAHLFAGLLNCSSCQRGDKSQRYVAGAAGVVVEGVCEEGRAGLFGSRELSSWLFGSYESKALARILTLMKSVVSLSKDSSSVAFWKC